jgi:2-amino-4-hydroxy-6-hydroxymethyldihydropteridine diphosphokinase
MKIKLSKNLELFFVNNFPFLSKKKSTKKHTVVVGVGGNIGNVIKRFQILYIYLKKSNSFDIIETAPILKNPPFGYQNQDDFFNTILVLKTNLNPYQTLKVLLRIEKKFKRKRYFKDSPRTLDLDIIFFDKINYFKKDLIIPHKDYHQRESVLIPLSFIKSDI